MKFDARKAIIAVGFPIFILGWCRAPSACAEVVPTWTPPIRLSSPGEAAKQPQIATVHGETLAVWLQFNGTNWIVQESSRPRGGNFSIPGELSAPAASASELSLVLNRSGAAVVLWKSTEGESQTIQASLRRGERERSPFAMWDPGEYSFSGPVDLSAAGEVAAEPSAAINYAGEAIAVWRRSDGTNNVIQTAELDPTTQTWSSPATLSAPGEDAAEPDAAIDYKSAVVVAWRRFNGTNQVAQAEMRKQYGSFSEPQNLSTDGEDASQPRVAINEFGANVVWEASGTGGDSIEESNRSESRGEFTEASDLGAAGPATDLHLEAGGELVTWFEGSLLHERTLSGEFSGPPTTVQLPDTVEELNLSGSPDFVWRAHSGAETAIEALQSGTPEPLTISSAGNSASEPAIAGYEAWADLAAIWVQPETDGSSVEASGLDVEGPQFPSRVYGPDERVGEPLEFFTPEGPSDLWSEIVSIEWDFGDGSSAIGEPVEHAFCAGAYSVRQTITNALGQSNSKESTLVVEGSNAPKIGTFLEELGSDGTGSLKVTVPCDGDIRIEGNGLQPWHAKLREAGELDIPIVAVGPARQEIERTGEATVEPQISFEPHGAPSEKAATSVTLFGQKEPQPLPPYWTLCSSDSVSTSSILVHRVGCEAAHRTLANLIRKLHGSRQSTVRLAGFQCRLRRKGQWWVHCHQRGRWIVARRLRRSPHG